MPRKKATPVQVDQVVVQVDVTDAGVQPVPAADLNIGQTSGITLLDQLACALLPDNIGSYDATTEGGLAVLENRFRKAYQRAQVMARIRDEFI